MKHMRNILFVIACMNAAIAPAQVIFSSKPVFGFAYQQETNDPFPVIKEVTLGSPAFLANLMVGDHLLRINNADLRDISTDALTAILRDAPQMQNVITVQHVDATKTEIKLNKANYITAEYESFRYTIFFDANSSPIYKEGENCLWTTTDCYNGYGYYVFDAYGAFYGEFENGNRKEGLYYHPVFGKPTYYLGEFLNNEYEGLGTLQYLSDDSIVRVYKGNFHNGAPFGQGEIHTADGRLEYTGGFNGWDYNGQGKYIFPDGTVKEGLWTNGQFADDIVMPSTETPDNTGYTAEEIEKAYKCRKAGLTEKEIRNFIMELRNPYSSDNSSSAGTTETLSGIDYETSVWNEVMKNYGYGLLEEFDIGFSINEIGTCFTGCSTGQRRIMLLIPHVYGIQVSDLYVVTSRLSGDISDVNYEHFPFELISSDGDYTVYNCNIVASEIHSGCSYQWQVLSEDGTRRFVRVLVFAIL